MLEKKDFVIDSLKLNNNFKATEDYLGQLVMKKISLHVLNDDELVQLIKQSNTFLKATLDKYNTKQSKIINNQLQNDIRILIFHSNYSEDRFKITNFVEKINEMIVSVSIQKNELATYRNEIKEIIQLTTVTPQNQQRIIDLGGVVQLLNLKIIKVEQDIDNGKLQIDSLSKFFDVTFFHIKESIDKNCTQDYYLDVMYKLSQLKMNNNFKKYSFYTLGAISILIAAYNYLASLIIWKTPIRQEVEFPRSLELLSNLLFVIIVGFGTLGVFSIFNFYKNKSANGEYQSLILSLLLLGISCVSFIFSKFISSGSINKIVGYEVYHIVNLSPLFTLIHIFIGLGLIFLGSKKMKNIEFLSGKQDELYRLCKGK